MCADTRNELIIVHMLDGLAGARTVAEFAGRECGVHIGDVSSGFPGIPLAAEAQSQKQYDCDRELYKEYRIATSSTYPSAAPDRCCSLNMENP